MDPGSSNTLNSLISSIDNLSVRSKQLPQRPQIEKPLLKYSNSEPGPIYLYQNPDLKPGLVNSAPNSPSKVLQNKKTISSTNAPSARKVTASPVHFGYVPPDDPYARPLSAKDLMTLGLERTKTLNHIMSSTLAGSLANSMHATNMSNISLFKTAKTPDGSPKQPSDTSSANSSSLPVNVNNHNTVTTTKVVSIHSAEANTVMTQSAKEKFEATLAKPASGSDRGTRPPSSLRRPRSSSVRNPNYSPAKPYEEVLANEEEDFKMVSDQRTKQDGEEGLNHRISKAISTLSRASSLVNRNCLAQHSSSESLDRPNSTHTVNSGSNQLICTKLTPTIPAALASTKTVNTAAAVRPISAVSCSSAGKGSGSSSASSRHHKRGDSATTYYLKSSKPEIKIAEPRPACEGRDSVVTETSAASLKRHQSGKTTSSNTSSATDRKSLSRSGSVSAAQGVADDDEDSNSDLSERFPGDGEADELEADDDFEDEEDDDEEVDDIYGLDDDVEGPDDDSDSLSSASVSASLRHSARVRSASLGILRVRSNPNQPIRMKSARRRTHSSYHDNTQPALIKSLFPNVPPYINFVTENERVEQLPWEYRRLLKWRMCSITPNIVRHVVNRSNFRPTKKHYDWLGCWGKHMKAPGFKSIREYQKLNHFPGSFQIGRKDRLWRNLSKLQVSFGKKEFSFFPTTYVLPYDMKGLKRAWEDGGGKAKWIIKPPASARGIGIKVVNKWNQIPKKRPVIVQKYLARPLLINDSKFDCRVYVYVTSLDPLRIYVYEDGLVRICSTKYSHSMKDIGNKYMHLTNYSVQKKSSEYESNADDTICQGHKWSLKSLWGYLLKRGVNTNEIWKKIKDLIVKTIISAESSINSYIKSNVRNRYSVHELFGFDILLDETYKPWVLEVNISPSLHSNSQLDINIKGGMIKDLHNLAGFRIPDKADLVANPSNENYKLSPPSNRYCIDKRVFPQSLSADEKAKHSYYSQRYQDEAVMGTIIDLLTPDDIRILIESIDEDSRKGSFQRVFPTPSTHRYLRYFETHRYYNLFLDQWCQRFNRIEAKGIALIEAACRNKVHLQNPTSDPRHQWCPPSSRISFSSSQLALGCTSSNHIVKLKKQMKKAVESSASGRPPLATSSSSQSIAAS